MPDDAPKPSILGTLGQHKGNIAKGGGVLTLTAVLGILLDHADDIAKMTKRNKETAEGAVPQWIYQSDRREMTSNIVALQIEWKTWKAAHP